MSLFSTRRRAARLASTRRWLQFETMEDRKLMAVYIVQTLGNVTPTGDGTLQNPFSTITQAVNAAKLNPGADEIQIGFGFYNESLNITDTADLTLRGSATRPILNGSIQIVQPVTITQVGQQTTTTKSNASFLIESINVNSSTSAGIFVNPLLPGDNLGPTRQLVRGGSVTLNNMQVTVPALGTSWNNIAVFGLNQFSANNLVLNNGRAWLNDINIASISQLTINTSKTNALAANFVTQLNVSGLVASQPAATGIQLTNPARTLALDSPSVVNLTSVEIIAAGGNGLDAGLGITLNVTNSTFKFNAGDGLSLNSVTATTLDNVDSNNNTRHGYSIVASTTSGPRTMVTGRSLLGNSNRASGFNALATGPINLVGALFSSNAGFGMFSDQAAVSLDLSRITANSNGQFGCFLRDTSGYVIASTMSTNDNLQGGMSISQTRAIASVSPIVGVYGLQSMRNGQIGLSIVNSERTIVGSAEASDNKGLGLYLSPAVGPVSLENSVFNRNSQSTTSSIKSGVLLTGVINGLRMFNVTANNNPADGINIDNVFGTIDANNIFASGNGISGLWVNNQSQPQRAELLLGFSNLSSNGKNGLLVNAQSKVVISRSRFDNNGPVSTQAIDFGTGAWIQNVGTGGVSIEDSTAIGTRVGVQTGGGILIPNAAGPEVQIRRVTINDTVVHPLTTTGFGAGLVVTGSTPGVRIEDSTFNHNLLADARSQRATIFATVPISLVRSQLLDNAGVSIEAASSLNVQDSTIARTTGIALRTTSGGTIVRSTLSGNTSEAVISSGAVVIDQSTLTGNATTINPVSPPNVIQNSGTLTLHNSIVAGNGVDSWAFSNSALATSIGFNLLSGTPIGWTGLASDMVGDLNNRIDPLLGPLTNNGGPTLTHMPLTGSVALEAGDASLIGANDQRGVSRPQGQTATPKVDIGSVEAAAMGTAPTFLLNALSTSANEGSPLTMRGRVSDLDGNLTSLVASIGTVQLLADNTFLWTLATRDDLSVSVTLTATDGLGGVGAATFTATAINVAPNVRASYVADPITRTISLETFLFDPGADVLAYTVNWGDGTSETFPNKTNSRYVVSHVYSTVWPSAIVVSASDEDGANSLPVSLAVNVQPIIEFDTPTATANEGSDVRMTGRVIDLDGNMGQLVASRGTVQLNADGTFVWTEFGIDDAIYPVVLTARDNLNATSTKSFTAQVNNVAPTLGPVTDTLDIANRIIIIRSNVTDVGVLDNQKLIVQWGDGTTETIPDVNGTRVFALGHQYASISGPISISVQALDDDGGLSQVSTITANVAPTIQLDTTSASGPEGSPITLTGRGFDLDGDLTSITATLGSVQFNPDGTFLWSYTGNDDLSSVVTLTATDSFGNVGSAAFNVQIVNAAPSLGAISKTLNSATRTVTLNTSVIDPGVSDTHIVTIQWGDGTTSTVTPAADRSVIASHQYAAVGAITILVNVTDDDGASSPSSEVVANVAPAIQLNATAVSGNEGSQLSLTGLASDADGNLVSLTSTIGSVQLNADGSFVWTYTGVDDVSNRVVDVTGTDAFGAVTRASFTFTVNNVAPTLGTTSANLNISTRTVTISTSVIDVGLADTHLFMIQWGDGTSSTVAPAANRTLTVSHLYSVFGPTVITIKATDDDGASSASTSLTQVIPGFVVRNRELFVYGSSLVDTVSFGVPNRGQVTANANFGGVTSQFIFASTAIDNVLGFLGAGNDVWNGNQLQESQMVFGEAGNDQITTGALDDILVGGDGADTLVGGAGGDLLFGGLGADVLYGQDGSDVLVAGRYDRETDLSALRMLRTAWIGTGTYATRIGRMRSGVGTDTQGVVVKLSIAQITDDAIDQLFGGNDTDWYLTNSATEVRGGTRDESTN